MFQDASGSDNTSQAIDLSQATVVTECKPGLASSTPLVCLGNPTLTFMDSSTQQTLPRQFFSSTSLCQGND